MGHLLQLVTEDIGIKADGSNEAIYSLLTTHLTCLDAVASIALFEGHELKCRVIAHLTLTISALLDALSEMQGRKAMATGQFQRLVRLTLPYMQERLRLAEQSSDRKSALRAVGDEFGEMYFAYQWLKYMSMPRPESI